MVKAAKFLLGLAVIAGFAAGAFYIENRGRSAADSGAKKGAAVPVIVDQVRRRPLVDRIEAIGTTYARDSAVLTAPVTETLVAIRFEDGQRVAKGDVLIELDNSVQRAQLKSAEATLDEARKQLDRIATLARRGSAAETSLDERRRMVQTAEAEVARMQAEIERRIIRAPFDGMVGLRRISPGRIVQPSDELLTLQDISVLKLDFTVPELYLTSLKAGQEIVARTPVYPGREFKGQVGIVESRVDPVSRAVTVRALIPNENGALAPGMLMTVDVIRARDMVLLVPEQAVIAEGPRRFVYRLQEDNTVRRVEIGAGRRTVGFVEIVDGVAEGDTIVVDGTIRINDGAKVAPRHSDGDPGNV